MKPTSLKTSQAIKELGIHISSPFGWYYRGGFEEEWNHKVLHVEEAINHGANLHKRCYAYTLSDLPSVLQAVGEKENWGEVHKWCGEPRICWCDSQSEQIEKWLYHFLHICELHARGEDWDEYLYELVTRR